MCGTQTQEAFPNEQEEQPSGMTSINVNKDIERPTSRRDRNTPTPTSIPKLLVQSESLPVSSPNPFYSGRAGQREGNQIMIP